MLKLYKSNKDKVFTGVIGGIGEYVDIDPTVLRLVFILLAIMTGIFPAVAGYIIATLIVPKKPMIHHMEHTEPEAQSKKEKSKKETPLNN